MPKNGKDFKLEELQGYVGGYIQIIPIDTCRIMVMDEEGKLKGKQTNDKATELLYGNIMRWDYVVGDVLVCGKDMVK